MKIIYTEEQLKRFKALEAASVGSIDGENQNIEVEGRDIPEEEINLTAEDAQEFIKTGKIEKEEKRLAAKSRHKKN
jgi:hypothetical protein